MKTKLLRRLLFCGTLLSSLANPVAAMDVGDPIFPKDLEGKTRAELIYQNLNRDLDTGGELLADVYALRIHTAVGQFASLDFDVGGIDPDGGDFGFYGGVGLRYLAHDGATWRVAPWLQAHYAPNLSEEDVDYDLLDGDAGVLLAAKIKIDNDLTLMPYAGPSLSIIRIEGDSDALPETAESDAEEDNILGAVAGITLQMPGQNSIRIEAQFFDQVSISAAAGISF